MVALMFLLVVCAVFATVLALEGGGGPWRRRPAGLLSWIASGNWPAKIGGGLVITGVGALLRYAAIHFAVPPAGKLAAGIIAAFTLGLGSLLSTSTGRHRAVSLALGGAAFGVAYLTAYSAFALFDYLPSLQGLGLLALVAVGAGVFAVTRSAQSLAVLSMVGAFMAPAFAVDDPGPRVVYGYYVAISSLVLMMVAVRGWRPLIHLSFLFTLAGGAFFAWTADYFEPAGGAQLLPYLVMLAAVHVAMPLLERRWTRGRVVESFDTVYLLALPVVAALTALVIAPSRVALAGELGSLALVWLVAAAWLQAQRRDGVGTHAVIGLLLAGLALAARYRELPWELVALAIAVAALALAARRPGSTRLHGFLAALVLLMSAAHMLGALAPVRSDLVFLNPRFLERMAGALLMLGAARVLLRLRHRLDTLMLTTAASWTVFAVGAEVSRLDLVSPWLLLHWTLCGVALMTFLKPRPRLTRHVPTPLVLALLVSGLVSQMLTVGDAAWISALVSAVGMLAIALRPVTDENGAEPSRVLGALGAPLMATLWMACYMRGFDHPHWQFPVAIGVGAASCVLLGASLGRARSEGWLDGVANIYALAFALVLAMATLFDIERTTSAVVLELSSVAGLVLVASWEGRRQDVAPWILPTMVIGIALVLQANLLRWLGPDGDLDALAILDMDWRALVSLLWASIGAALTIGARRAGSRMQWSAGATFLVGSAIKFVLVDFGSLGELANILAVIAAGGVFLLVGWLAPIPPARESGTVHAS